MCRVSRRRRRSGDEEREALKGSERAREQESARASDEARELRTKRF